MRASAAIAEKDLAERHRTVWPPRLTAIDADWQSGDTVLLEAPSQYQTIVPIEYKSTLAGALDLNGWQFSVFRRAVNQAAPAFVAQFTNPPNGDAWAFRLHPMVEISGVLLDHRPITLTERQLVELLTLIATGKVYGLQVETFASAFEVNRQRKNRLAGPCARCGEHVGAGRGFLAYNKESRRPAPVHNSTCGTSANVTAAENAGREFFTHLDDIAPQPSVWPKVTPLREYEAFVPRFSLELARSWIAEHTDHFANGPTTASITPLLPNRPALGGLRRKKLAGREELQRDYVAREASSWPPPPARVTPAWVGWTRPLQTRLTGPFAGSRRSDAEFAPTGTQSPELERPRPHREPAQVGQVRRFPVSRGVQECGITDCAYLTGEEDDRGPICRFHQNPPGEVVVDPSERRRDRELLPHESGVGWACPVCLRSSGMFAGEVGQRRCFECFREWPELTNAEARERLRRGGR